MLWIILFPATFFVALTAYLYFYQRSFVFIPAKEFAVTPDQVGLTHEEVSIKVADDEQIHCWFFPASAEQPQERRVVLFCHGNAGNISHRLPTAQMFADLNISLLMVDYRGYGKSDGRPGEQELYADARSAFDWLAAEKGFAPEEIVIFGRSLGGAVGVELATQVKCAGLIVESSFTSAVDLGRKAYPIFPISMLLRHRFESLDRISTIDCRLLVTHSPADDIIPFEMGRTMFEKAGQPKRFFEIFGLHNERDYLNDAAYRQMVREFILGDSTGDSEQS